MRRVATGVPFYRDLLRRDEFQRCNAEQRGRDRRTGKLDTIGHRQGYGRATPTRKWDTANGDFLH
jgi:hypothetical protein